ncbi:MAG TPA: hypothetical protein PL161_11325 [Spirochaetota bacterium]|nr:hypothetical protein [Spirochaetota bacterium]
MKEAYLKIIDYVDAFISKNQCSPTIREIADGVSSNHNTINFQVKTLTVKGYLSYIPGKQRTIRVVKHPEQEAV